MTTGFGLSAAAIELYNLLIAFGWTPERSYTFAQKYDLAYDANGVVIDTDFARVIDDTITQLETEWTETQRGIQEKIRTAAAEPHELIMEPSLSAYPIETIKQELLKSQWSGNLGVEFKTPKTIEEFRKEYGLSAKYGTTAESWAEKRAQEIKWGVGGKMPEGYVQPELPPYVTGGVPPTMESRGATERAQAEGEAQQKAAEAKRIADEKWKEMVKRLNPPEKMTRI